jgi:hypothetical protein
LAGEKLRFEVQAGGAVGILTGTEGSIYINPGLDGLVAQNNHQEQFREWQFNLLLRAGGIRYDITPPDTSKAVPVAALFINKRLEERCRETAVFGLWHKSRCELSLLKENAH